MNAYKQLVERHEEIATLSSCAALLSWDQETYMPAKAVTYRAKQRAYLSQQSHMLTTAPEVAKWLDDCGPCADDTIEDANVRWWRHAHARATKLPTDLVGAIEEATSLAVNAWQDALAKDDFGLFQPHLQTIIDHNRRKTDLWGYEESPYDALLEEYERGARASQLSSLFGELRPELVSIVEQAVAQSKSKPAKSLKGDYPIPAQQAFNREVCEAFGFDNEAGRIDTTTHPFCSRVAPHDTRLTTRYDETDFTSSLFGVLHETGHGLYEQGLCQECFAQPQGTSVSLGIHESQSRLWENQVGRSADFWNHWLPVAAKHFPHLANWTPEEMTRAVNQAALTFIRVEADEVTYDLHIMLRFEIEKQLIEGNLKVQDLPEQWNATFKDLTGLEVTNNVVGCLQDIHWSIGALGYFPTYSLGNLNAAQLFEAALAQTPSLNGDLAQGQYASLLVWLKSNVHQHGCRYLPNTLMEKATGRTTGSEAYLKHLRSRYLTG